MILIKFFQCKNDMHELRQTDMTDANKKMTNSKCIFFLNFLDLGCKNRKEKQFYKTNANKIK